MVVLEGVRIKAVHILETPFAIFHCYLLENHAMTITQSAILCRTVQVTIYRKHLSCITTA